jgi:lipoprotein-releasing system ATP-binding protein
VPRPPDENRICVRVMDASTGGDAIAAHTNADGTRTVPATLERNPVTSKLAVTELGKSYPTRSGSLVVLRDVDLDMQPGDAAAILGPSGSGKSTLLQILGALDRPTKGKVALGDIDPFGLSESALAKFRNRHVGFVFQDHHLLPQCSVLENVLVPTLAAGGVDRAALMTRAKKLLDRVGLAQRLDHRPAELSGGERQRVALARALILQPPLLLADEPTGNLDRVTAHNVGELLLELHREEKNIFLVVTHSPELARLLPVQYEMLDGRLVPWKGGRAF